MKFSYVDLGLAVGLLMFLGFALAIILTSPSHPEVTKTWTLPDGEICHTFRGYDGVTCTR